MIVLSRSTSSPEVATRTLLPSRWAASRTGSRRRAKRSSTGTIRARVISLWRPETMLPKAAASSANWFITSWTWACTLATSSAIAPRLRARMFTSP